MARLDPAFAKSRTQEYGEARPRFVTYFLLSSFLAAYSRTNRSINSVGSEYSSQPFVDKLQIHLQFDVVYTTQQQRKRLAILLTSKAWT
jgi:hypothetical protein